MYIRCQQCRKVMYATLEAAQETSRVLWEQRGWKVGPYYKPSCGAWHLTRQVERAARNRQHFRPMKIQLRDYQEYAVGSIFEYFAAHPDGNPIAALPTGTGKSIVIAEFTRRACTWFPGTRVLMLTHVKELIEQNLKKLLAVWPSAPAGVYSAGLKRRDTGAQITYAGIASVARKPEIFGHIDLVLIDECHLVSPRGTTQYMQFLNALREVNPRLRVIGLTATAYRLGHGMLTDSGGLFTDICVDLTSREAFNALLAEGWLAPLVPRKTAAEIDVGEVQIRAGEFVQSELQAAVDRESVTRAAITETIAAAEDRQHWLVFASGVDHAEHVAAELVASGIPAAAVHSRIPDDERDARLAAFEAGRLRALVNNNVLTTGYDFPAIDCIVMLRPTASPGLWVQMLGRGTRPSPGKENCLVLDFAGNTERLGPINDPVLPRRPGKGQPGVAPVRLCKVELPAGDGGTITCNSYSHASARFCEHCGTEFPREVKFTAEASSAEVIAAGSRPVFTAFDVDRVEYSIHRKDGRPDSMRVDYYCGLRRFSEYICLDHGGYAGRLAHGWWRLRCPWGAPPNVHAGMLAVNSLREPVRINVITSTKYPDIIGYEFAD